MEEKELGIIEISVAIILSIISVILSYYLADQLKNYENIEYGIIFVISLLSSASIFLPTPGWAVLIGFSKTLNPILLGVIFGIGSGLGESTSYLAGLGGGEIIGSKKIKMFKEHHKWIKKEPAIVLFVLSLLPNPFFDIAGLSAGVLELDYLTFIIPTIAGKTLRYILAAVFFKDVLLMFF